MNKEEAAAMADLSRGLKDLGRSFDNHSIAQREDFDKVFTKLDELYGKFAGKWVEKWVIGFLITVTAGLILFIIASL